MRHETEERWRDYSERNKSYIDHLFTGLYRSTVLCSLCRHSSVTYDPFVVLSLPIPTQTATVDACLKQFFSPEALQTYFCLGCKQESPTAHLNVEIAKAPEVLVIHLKRFQSMVVTNNFNLPVMRKIRGPIAYEKTLTLKTGPLSVKYSLKGIAVHWGVMEHGHYISVVEREGKWYYCNDRVISECEERVAMSQEAYMLFYERLKNHRKNK